MNLKKIIVSLFLCFVVLTSAFSVNNEYVPEFDVFVQPLDGQRYSINDFRSLQIGKEYNLIITCYVRKQSSLFSFFQADNIDCLISFLSPLKMDVKAQNVTEVLNTNDNKVWKFKVPTFTEARNESDRLTYTFRFTPKSAGEQDIKILFDGLIDSYYTKIYRLKVDGIASKKKPTIDLNKSYLNNVLVSNKVFSEKTVSIECNMAMMWLLDSESSLVAEFLDPYGNVSEYPMTLAENEMKKVNKANINQYCLKFTTGKIDIDWKKNNLSFKGVKIHHSTIPSEIVYNIKDLNKMHSDVRPISIN